MIVQVGPDDLLDVPVILIYLDTIHDIVKLQVRFIGVQETESYVLAVFQLDN